VELPSHRLPLEKIHEFSLLNIYLNTPNTFSSPSSSAKNSLEGYGHQRSLGGGHLVKNLSKANLLLDAVTDLTDESAGSCSTKA
jgi:hypothetical protein